MELSTKNKQFIDPSKLTPFETVLALHSKAIQCADETRTLAGKAISCAIEAGKILLKEKESRRGEFLLWLQTEIASASNSTKEFISADKFSQATAYRYMKIARFDQEHPDQTFSTIKEYYVATGIMPPPESQPLEDRERPTFTLRFRTTKPLNEWPQSERLEFLEMAKPIVDQYQELLASDPSLSSMLN